MTSKRGGTLKRKQPCSVLKAPPSQPQAWRKSHGLQVGAPEKNHFSSRFDTSCNGFTLAWQANGLALMVLPIKPQSFVAAQTHFSLSLCGLQQTTHVTFVWVIYCLGKGSMKLLFREKRWDSSAHSIRTVSSGNITAKPSLIKRKDSGEKNNPPAFKQQNFSKMLLLRQSVSKPSTRLALNVLLVPASGNPTI